MLRRAKPFLKVDELGNPILPGQGSSSGGGGGSRWWRAVNDRLNRDMDEAGLLDEMGLAQQGFTGSYGGVAAWLNYMNNPSSETWYQAHNVSIVQGYAENIDLAYVETPAERHLMADVLLRVLFAQSMLTDPGINSSLADPRGAAVGAAVGIPMLSEYFYPLHYPLTFYEGNWNALSPFEWVFLGKNAVYYAGAVAGHFRNDVSPDILNVTEELDAFK